MKDQDIREWLAGRHIVRKLETYLEENFETFLDVRNQYLNAVEQFRKELDIAVSPSVDDMVDAIEEQAASSLFFSGILGIKSNLDHFMNPMGRTVLDVDFDVFLREETARRLPICEQAEEIIDSFVARLGPKHKALFGDVIEYTAYLETCGPKLAHYFGYVLGDKLLPNLVLGYYPDKVLTMQYKAMLELYLGLNNLETESNY